MLRLLRALARSGSKAAGLVGVDRDDDRGVCPTVIPMDYDRDRVVVGNQVASQGRCKKRRGQ